MIKRFLTNNSLNWGGKTDFKLSWEKIRPLMLFKASKSFLRNDALISISALHKTLSPPDCVAFVAPLALWQWI